MMGAGVWGCDELDGADDVEAVDVLRDHRLGRAKPPNTEDVVGAAVSEGVGAPSNSALLTTSIGGEFVPDSDPAAVGATGRVHLALTPSTALKKLVDPAVSVLETASRAGASC